jgi:hypothetical protein
LTARAAAATGDAGQIGSTLRIGFGARALALGQAFVAMADDESAIFYNPGGLAQVRRPSLGTAWRVMPELSRRQGYVDLAIPLREQASLGLAWIYSGVGDLVERNAQGVAGESFTFSELFFTLAFAKPFGRVVALGGSAHYAQQNLFDVSAGTVGLSAGVHARFDREARRPYPEALQRLTLGAAVQHVGMTLRFDSRDYYEPRGQGTGTITNETYPLVVRWGGAYRLLANRNLQASLEGTWVEDQHARLYAGAEWSVEARLFLRAGLADLEPTAGFGLRQTWGKTTLYLDYAFLTSPAGLSADHAISLGVSF